MPDARLDTAARRSLLELARASIRSHLESGRSIEPGPASGELARPRGAFVTLTRKGELRGCIGHIRSERPLIDVIVSSAIAAATGDPRFPALTIKELDEVDIDVSVLTPLQPIRPDEVEVGRHGLMIELDGRSGVLLPQVATERGWDRETFLENLCRKAGLPADAWKDGRARLRGFTAEVFGENDDDS